LKYFPDVFFILYAFCLKTCKLRRIYLIAKIAIYSAYVVTSNPNNALRCQREFKNYSKTGKNSMRYDYEITR